MTQFFRVVEHTVNGAHSREYATATANGDVDRPRLAVKQYIPLDNPNPQPGDVTIIGAHANAFPKVLTTTWAVAEEYYVLTVGRNCMSRCGMNFTCAPPRAGSASGPSGSPTCGIKASRAC